MKTASALGVLALVLALGTAQAASATGLLGVAGVLEDPIINYDVTGTLHYDGAGDFQLDALVLNGTPNPLSDAVVLNLSVTTSGDLLGGTLTVGGGSLVSATATDFGYQGGSSNSLFDVLLVTDGGSVYAPGSTIGMTIDATLNQGSLDFASAFSAGPGLVKGSIGGVSGAVPEPSSALMFGIALAFVHMRSRRRQH